MPPPPAGYAADSDADDEYERSLMTSPTVATDDDTSPTESDPPSTENTPTTFGHGESSDASPRTIITEWTTDECAGFIKSLGLAQYCGSFLGMCSWPPAGAARKDGSGTNAKSENEIVGEALVALRHDELKEMGVASVGHRLTILKGVYETKIKQDIPFEADHYVPLCTSPERSFPALEYLLIAYSGRGKQEQPASNTGGHLSPDSLPEAS
jgi:protein STE50